MNIMLERDLEEYYEVFPEERRASLWFRDRKAYYVSGDYRKAIQIVWKGKNGVLFLTPDNWNTKIVANDLFMKFFNFSGGCIADIPELEEILRTQEEKIRYYSTE